MEKTINSFEARRSFGKLMQDVAARGDKIIVERHGTPVAVLVPLEVYEQWKRSRERFFELLEMGQSNANLTPEAADNLALEVVEELRQQKQAI
jgi:prevent-host-death family protein